VVQMSANAVSAPDASLRRGRKAPEAP
jgi:hypothetical protein